MKKGIRNRIREDFDEIVRTGRDLSVQFQENHEIKIKSLSELMGAYKTTSSKKIHLLGNVNSIAYANFRWQRSFHDHIIRTDRSFERISEYIKNNPGKWNKDRFACCYLKNNEIFNHGFY